MVLSSDKQTFIDALAAYDEYMLRAVDISDPNEYLKIKEEALQKAGEVIAAYRERATNICF